MDAFQAPIFASGGRSDTDSGSMLDNDLDDIFVDDFMSRGEDQSALPTSMVFGDFQAAPDSFSDALAPGVFPRGAASTVNASSRTSFSFSGSQMPPLAPMGAALLQHSGQPSQAGASSNSATLADIAANPGTSQSVALAALAATRAANSQTLPKGASGAASNAETAENGAAGAEASAGNRSRRVSAKAANEKIKEVVAEERFAAKRPLEPTGDSDDDDDDDEDDEDADDDEPGGAGRGKRRRSMNNSERQARRYVLSRCFTIVFSTVLVCSRERNRVHARKSRLRKKFFVDSLKSNLTKLEAENARMRAFLQQHTGKSYEELAASDGSGVMPGSAAASTDGNLLAGPSRAATRQLEDPDYKLVQALTVSQQNFVVSDPNLPDNPIVFASSGFYQLTGYSPAEVVGRNCRFLQGPGTDPDSITVIREGIKEGRDVAVCLVNYRKDGSPFWNQFFVAPLRGVDGRIVNFVGVQCEVSEKIAKQSLVAARLAATQAAAASSKFGTHTRSK
jgi:PAS domain S-box-containing protein